MVGSDHDWDGPEVPADKPIVPIVNDFTSIAQRLRELEAERAPPPRPQEAEPVRQRPIYCETCRDVGWRMSPRLHAWVTCNMCGNPKRMLRPPT